PPFDITDFGLVGNDYLVVFRFAAAVCACSAFDTVPHPGFVDDFHNIAMCIATSTSTSATGRTNFCLFGNYYLVVFYIALAVYNSTSNGGVIRNIGACHRHTVIACIAVSKDACTPNGRCLSVIFDHDLVTIGVAIALNCAANDSAADRSCVTGNRDLVVAGVAILAVAAKYVVCGIRSTVDHLDICTGGGIPVVPAFANVAVTRAAGGATRCGVIETPAGK